MNIKTIIKKIWAFALDMIFPRRCPVCDNVVPYGKLICSSCRLYLTYVKEPRCFKCGKGLNSEEQELCYDCSRIKHKFEQGLALYEYDSICNSLYRLKYNNRVEYAYYFGNEMAKRFAKNIELWQVDGIIPVPMYKGKEKTRGYNQAALLAEAMAKSLKIPYYPRYLIRKNNTIPLKQLDPKARQINLKNAFIIGANDVKLNRVVIVDDIYTTGSTMDELTSVLMKSGISKVYYITLAIGSGI